MQGGPLIGDLTAAEVRENFLPSDRFGSHLDQVNFKYDNICLPIFHGMGYVAHL